MHYYTPTANTPVGFEVQVKDQLVVNQDKYGNDKFKRKARFSINQLARKLVLQALKNVGYIDSSTIGTLPLRII